MTTSVEIRIILIQIVTIGTYTVLRFLSNTVEMSDERLLQEILTWCGRAVDLSRPRPHGGWGDIASCLCGGHVVLGELILGHQDIAARVQHAGPTCDTKERDTLLMKTKITPVYIALSPLTLCSHPDEWIQFCT